MGWNPTQGSLSFSSKNHLLRRVYVFALLSHLCKSQHASYCNRFFLLSPCTLLLCFVHHIPKSALDSSMEVFRIPEHIVLCSLQMKMSVSPGTTTAIPMQTAPTFQPPFNVHVNLDTRETASTVQVSYSYQF